MILRKYQESDYDTLRKMLEEEGLKPEGMRFDWGDYRTWVMVDGDEIAGFFTLTPLRKVQHLQHFCLKRDRRDPMMGVRLEKFMRGTLIDMGCPIVIISIESGNRLLRGMVESWYGKQPYEEKDGHANYCVNVLEVQDGQQLAELPRS